MCECFFFFVVYDRSCFFHLLFLSETDRQTDKPVCLFVRVCVVLHIIVPVVQLVGSVVVRFAAYLFAGVGGVECFVRNDM